MSIGALSSEDTLLVTDLIERSELSSIEFHEVSAKRYEGAPGVEEKIEGQVSLNLQQRADENGFGLRIVSDVSVPAGEVRVTAAVEYKLLRGDQPPRRVVELFANEVAVMTLYPYLREGVASVSAKVFGSPITLPVAQRGQLGFDISDSDDAV